MKKKLLALSLLLVGGCAQIQPGSDPLVVRVEQAESLGYSTFDTFLKLDNQVELIPSITNTWASAHSFAQYLRQPILNGTNTVPFGIATILSLDQIKISYENGLTTSNSLVIAVTTLETTISQVAQYKTLISTNSL